MNLLKQYSSNGEKMSKEMYFFLFSKIIQFCMITKLYYDLFFTLTVFSIINELWKVHMRKLWNIDGS